MTTIKQTFDEDSKVGDTIGDIISAIDANDLTQSETLAVVNWLYVSYRISKDIEIVPDPTP